jgi:hypothetical protein
MPPHQQSRRGDHSGYMTSSGEIPSRPPPRSSDESIYSQASYGGRGYDDDDDEVKSQKSQVSVRTANTRRLIKENSFAPQPSGPYKPLPQSVPTRGGPAAQASQSSAYPQRTRVETDYNQSSNRQPAPTVKKTYTALPTHAGYAQPSNRNPADETSFAQASERERQEAWDDFQRKHRQAPSSPASSTVKPERSRDREPAGRTYNRPQYGETLDDGYRQEPRKPTSTARGPYKDEREDDGYRQETRAARTTSYYRDGNSGSGRQETRAPPPPPITAQRNKEDRRDGYSHSPSQDKGSPRSSAPSTARHRDEGSRPRSRLDDQYQDAPIPPRPARPRREERDTEGYSQPPSGLAPPPIDTRARSPAYIPMPREEEFQTQTRPGPTSTVRASYDDGRTREKRASAKQVDPSYAPPIRGADPYIQQVSDAGTEYQDKPKSRRDSAMQSPTTGSKVYNMPERPKRLSADYNGYEHKNSPSTPNPNPRSPLSQVPMNHDRGNDDRLPSNPTRQTYLSPTGRETDYFSPKDAGSRAEYKSPFEEPEEPYVEAVKEQKRNPRPPESPNVQHAFTDNRPDNSRRTSRTGSNMRSDSTASTARRDKETEIDLRLARLRNDAMTAERSRRMRMEEWATAMGGKRLQDYREQLGSHLARQLASSKNIQESVKKWNVNPETTRSKLANNNNELLFDFTDKYNKTITDIVKDHCDRQDDQLPSSTVKWGSEIKSRNTEGGKGSLESPGFRVIASYTASIAGKEISNQIKEVFDDERRNRKVPVQEVFQPTIGTNRSKRIEEGDSRGPKARDSDRDGRSRLMTNGSEYEESREDRDYERRPKQKQITDGSQVEESRGSRKRDKSSRRTIYEIPTSKARSLSRRRVERGSSRRKEERDKDREREDEERRRRRR